MRFLIWLAFALAVACPAASAKSIKVTATFSILADLTREAGGDTVEIVSLIAPEQDAHGFDPKPSDIRALAQADLIVANGLGFEPWLAKAMAAAKPRARLVIATRGITAMPLPDDHHGHDHDPKHAHAKDPHAWQNASFAKTYVWNIAAGLAAADPVHASNYTARAQAAAARFDRLHQEVRAALDRVPSARRVAVTNHDAFQYFGAAYGVRFLSPLGVSPEGEPSAAAVAALIQQIRRERITAVFVDNLDDPRLIDQIARETGAKVGPRLYSDALSKADGPAATYEALMRYNARTLANAMQ
jgi:zinc/manganese transport system substrate-binding protein